MIELVVDWLAGARHALSAGQYGCDVRIPHPTVLRRHASLTIDKAGAAVTDLGSRHDQALVDLVGSAISECLPCVSVRIERRHLAEYGGAYRSGDRSELRLMPAGCRKSDSLLGCFSGRI